MKTKQIEDNPSKILDLQSNQMQYQKEQIG